ncbi:transcription factor BEE 3 [Spatholobus suberectus]|nr:transcription factor BEE 3 [Spatholobus suberectus]
MPTDFNHRLCYNLNLNPNPVFVALVTTILTRLLWRSCEYSACLTKHGPYCNWTFLLYMGPTKGTELQKLKLPRGFLCSLEPEFPGNLGENFSGFMQCVNHNVDPILVPISLAKSEIYEGKKRKASDVCEPSSANSTPTVSESGSKTKNVRRGKFNEKLRC